eukprot:Nitzschia sp. Nitz4//scaffold12_size214221//72449//73660//NITZ4_001492-RA/size214221-augustus-gene-0.5-mRNA-1//1//CDS//3329534996//292//frame0
MAKRKADEMTKNVEEGATEELTDNKEPSTPGAAVVPPGPSVAETPTVGIAGATEDDVVDLEDKDDEDDVGATPSGKRRFFPRVKHLLTREWEPFLTGVLDALEHAEAPSCPAASHKLTNPWYHAFDLVYGGVAQDCSIPHGKNRYHKFKDKIVELWVAMEQHGADDHPLKARSNEQLETYRKACAVQSTVPKKDGGSPPPKTPATPKLPIDPKTGTLRRNSLPAAPAPTKWKHLDEAAALQSLPDPLKSIVHVRHLTLELASPGRPLVEERFTRLLEEYLKEVPTEKQALMAKANELAFLHRYAQSPKEARDIWEAFGAVTMAYCMATDTVTVTV